MQVLDNKAEKEYGLMGKWKSVGVCVGVWACCVGVVWGVIVWGSTYCRESVQTLPIGFAALCLLDLRQRRKLQSNFAKRFPIIFDSLSMIFKLTFLTVQLH